MSGKSNGNIHTRAPNIHTLAPGPMFPIPIELNGVRVTLNGDGTVSGETEKFLKMAPKLLREASPHMNVLTWLMVNAIRREVLASAAMSERLDGVALVDAKGEVEG